LALWAVPHLGVRRLERLQIELTARWGELLDRPLQDWVGQLELPARVESQLKKIATLETLAQTLEARVERGNMRVVFQGDPEFPERLAEISDAPPLLFVQGTLGLSQPRLAMVGSRHPEGGFLPQARRLARQVAERGVGIVSGAAEGVDCACHWGALDAGQSTWAFVGSALDCVEGAQRALREHVLARGGAFFSELPPGVQARAFTFPRRNRLISGASDAVLVLRATGRSGTLHTARAARKQGRPLFALTGEAHNPAVTGCDALLSAGEATPCTGADDLMDALKVSSRQSSRLESSEGLSEQAQQTYGLLKQCQGFQFFDEVLNRAALEPADLLSALSELELNGLVIQHPGRQYERV
jgi:DNA protecting protein DprA